MDSENYLVARVKMNFNCVIVGDSGVGKSVYIKRHKTGIYDYNHIPTTQETLTTVTFHSQIGVCNFKIYEAGLPSKAECAIILFDLNNQTSYDNVANYYTQLTEKYGSIPIIICGNKVDQKVRTVLHENIQIHRQLQCIYFDISAKSNYNFEKPFLFLLRKLVYPEITDYNQLCQKDLTFVAAPGLLPPTITVVS